MNSNWPVKFFKYEAFDEATKQVKEISKDLYDTFEAQRRERVAQEAWEKLIKSVEWNTVTIDKDIYQEMQEELKSLREQVKEPDWSESNTLTSSFWKSPLYSMRERLQYADGAIKWRDDVIKNLQKRLKELTQ